MKWIQKLLGMDTLQAQIAALHTQLNARSSETPPPTDTPTPPLPDPVAPAHPEVEAAIAQLWADSPQAAQMTRTYAKAYAASGKDVKWITRAIHLHGETID